MSKIVVLGPNLKIAFRTIVLYIYTFERFRCSVNTASKSSALALELQSFRGGGGHIGSSSKPKVVVVYYVDPTAVRLDHSAVPGQKKRGKGGFIPKDN